MPKMKKLQQNRSRTCTANPGSRFSTCRTTGIATSRRIDAGRRNRRRIVPHVTSALMKDKHYLYRVAVTCYVDSLFYETGNARRCHERCHSLITQTLCGIGKSTCRNYLRYDRSELLRSAAQNRSRRHPIRPVARPLTRKRRPHNRKK